MLRIGKSDIRTAVDQRIKDLYRATILYKLSTIQMKPIAIWVCDCVVWY